MTNEEVRVLCDENGIKVTEWADDARKRGERGVVFFFKAVRPDKRAWEQAVRVENPIALSKAINLGAGTPEEEAAKTRLIFQEGRKNIFDETKFVEWITDPSCYGTDDYYVIHAGTPMSK